MLRGREIRGFLVCWFLVVWVSWFFGVLVSKFQGVKVSWFLGFEVSMIPYYQKSTSYFLEDIDPISRFSRNFKTDLPGLSVSVFSKFENSRFPKLWDL